MADSGALSAEPRRSTKRAESEPEVACFFCSAADDIFSALEDDDATEDETDEMVRRRLARACAYGLEVLGEDQALMVCDDCDTFLREARHEAKGDLRAAERNEEARPARARRR
jgi:hypothetical protein